MIQFKVVGAEQAANGLMLSGQRANYVVDGAVRVYGLTLLSTVKKNAAGRPGPNIITGEYHSSISLERDGSGPIASATVYSDSEYGPALEYGRQGAPAYPHFRPAADEIEPDFVDYIRAGIRRI